MEPRFCFLCALLPRAEGRESRAHQQGAAAAKSLAQRLRTSLLKGELPTYKDNPRLLPRSIKPRLEKFVLIWYFLFGWSKY